MQEDLYITDNFSFGAIKNGNAKEFEALFRKYYPSMCAVAMKFVRDKVVAEDLVQEAFIRLWTKRGEYEAIPNLKTFLYVAVKNLCFNYLRDKKETIDYEAAGLENLEDHFKNYLIEEETYRMITEAGSAIARPECPDHHLGFAGKAKQRNCRNVGNFGEYG